MLIRLASEIPIFKGSHKLFGRSLPLITQPSIATDVNAWISPKKSRKYERNFEKLLKMYHNLCRQYKRSVHRFRQLELSSTVDLTKPVFVQIQSVLHSFHQRLAQIHDQLQQYYTLFLNPLSDTSSPHGYDTSLFDRHIHFVQNVAKINKLDWTAFESESESEDGNEDDIEHEGEGGDVNVHQEEDGKYKHEDEDEDDDDDEENKEKNESAGEKKEQITKDAVETEETQSPKEATKNRYQFLADIHVQLISIFIDLHSWASKIQIVVSSPYLFV
ncbi:hypothetical protein RFI_23543 [Reticulomyxa filosa]|uniref:Uncharacterized protein n=1 Tax=Reticulomyxa filosa TaxID=46433 RepID=X6MJK0_RETFI|nr:hypothetical protein RFI_23543 [Reticulomyxa filosa]|eukprot:ETO13826.1 hypothetical protein RFI_23543 [Reticulomyxa filosa]